MIRVQDTLIATKGMTLVTRTVPRLLSSSRGVLTDAAAACAAGAGGAGGLAAGDGHGERCTAMSVNLHVRQLAVTHQDAPCLGGRGTIPCPLTVSGSVPPRAAAAPPPTDAGVGSSSSEHNISSVMVSCVLGEEGARGEARQVERVDVGLHGIMLQVSSLGSFRV